MIYSIRKSSKLELFVFILSMVFTPQYLNIEIRPFIYGFWIFISLIRLGPNLLIKVRSYVKITVLFLIIIILYSLLVFIVTASEDHWIYIRYIRALLSFIVIVIYVNSVSINANELINCLLTVISIHALLIIAGIIYPETRSMLTPFSGVPRMFWEFRSSGLVNSFEIAGLYTSLGIVLVAFRFKDGNRIFLIFLTFLFLTATIFTSRLNLVVLFGVLFYVQRILFKHTIVFRLLTIIMLVVALSVLALTWVLTTDINLSLRNSLFRYQVFRELYTRIRYTYPDNELFLLLNRALIIEHGSVTDLFFGQGTQGDTPFGFLKTISSIGIIGLIGLLSYNILLFNILAKLKPSTKLGVNYQVYIVAVFLLLAIVFGNFKLMFFFTSNFFEMFSLFFLKLEDLSLARRESETIYSSSFQRHGSTIS